MIDATKFRTVPVSALQAAYVPINAKAVPVDSGKVQLSRYSGDMHSDNFSVFYTETGLPVDLSGMVLKMHLKIKPSDDAVTSSVLGDVLDAESGKVAFYPDETQAQTKGFFHYEIIMTDPMGIATSLVKSSYVYR